MIAPELSIAERRAPDGTPVVAVAGEIDLFTAPELKQAIARATRARSSRLILDLTDSSFIDSSSLGVLIGAHRRLALHGGALVIVCPGENIAKTLRITGLDGLFRVVRSLDEAVEQSAPA
jgi:anti-sigma B factor antagonist